MTRWRFITKIRTCITLKVLVNTFYSLVLQCFFLLGIYCKNSRDWSSFANFVDAQCLTQSGISWLLVVRHEVKLCILTCSPTFFCQAYLYAWWLNYPYFLRQKLRLTGLIDVFSNTQICHTLAFFAQVSRNEATTTQTDQGYSLLNFAFLGLLKDL